MPASGIPKRQSQMMVGLDFMGDFPDVAKKHTELIFAGAALRVLRTHLLGAERFELRERFF